MTLLEMSNLIRKWFEKADQVNGPLLPDGWAGGRPYDNTYWLKDVEISGDTITVYLISGEAIKHLVFEGLERVYLDDSELVFENFRIFSFRWKDRDENGKSVEQWWNYDYGQVRFVPPVGTTVVL